MRQLLYLHDFACEMPAHEPTLDGAAYFLATGKYNDADDVNYFEDWDDADKPKHGDVFEATISTSIWEGHANYAHACPSHDWAAETYGQNQGWDSEGVYSSLSEAIENGASDSWYVAFTDSQHKYRLDLSDIKTPKLEPAQ